MARHVQHGSWKATEEWKEPQRPSNSFSQLESIEEEAQVKIARLSPPSTRRKEGGVDDPPL